MVGKDIQYAKTLLENGEIVAIPTETVYGLAGNALNEVAVQKIFNAKQRPSFNPLILHVANIEAIEKYSTEMPRKLRQLCEKFMPGPLTLLLPKKNIVPDIITAGSHRVAIRIPNHIVTKALLSELDFPLAAPSANPFGYISPTSPQHVEAQLGNKVSYILDGGICDVGIESTIVGMEEGKIIVYRKGGLSVESIVDEIGAVFFKENEESMPETPGMLASHYAPKTQLILKNLNLLQSEYDGLKIAILTFGKKNVLANGNVFNLSEDENLEEAAHNLYKILREIDGMGFDVILAELLPDTGLGKAINDRLRRAASR